MDKSEKHQKAANERWNPTIPRATHIGLLNLSGNILQCAVLEDGRRIITKTDIYKCLGRSRPSSATIKRSEEVNLPVFMLANNLTPYLEEENRCATEQIEFRHPSGRRLKGFEAKILPEACKMYVKADDDGVLQKQQKAIAIVCRSMLYALASVGITALVDECTGFQKKRENDELQKLFSAFIAKELQPWVKRFPEIFFSNLKRMYGMDEMKNNASFFGHLINKWVYKELSPEVLVELKRVNPIKENGYRKHAHHRYLTQDIGCPALDKQIQKVITLMSVSDSKEDFERLLEKSKKI